MCFPVAVLKGLCVLCAQRQKRKIDQEGKGGVKGGVEGGRLDICQWCTSARQCLSHAGCWHTGSCRPPLSLSINTDTAARLTAPRPPQPDWHHTDAQTRTQGWKMDLRRVSPVLFRGVFLISLGNRHTEFSYELKSMLAVIRHLVSVSWYCVVHPGCLSHCRFLLEHWNTSRRAVFCVTHVNFPLQQDKMSAYPVFSGFTKFNPICRLLSGHCWVCGAVWCRSFIPSFGHASCHC